MKNLLRLLVAALPFAMKAADAVRADAGTHKSELVSVGLAKLDVTPDYAVRLSGYGNRRAESEGVAQRIHAKALAIGSDEDGPAVLITVDNCGVPAAMREEVLRRLAAKRSSPMSASPFARAIRTARRCSSACCRISSAWISPPSIGRRSSDTRAS